MSKNILLFRLTVDCVCEMDEIRSRWIHRQRQDIGSAKFAPISTLVAAQNAQVKLPNERIRVLMSHQIRAFTSAFPVHRTEFMPSMTLIVKSHTIMERAGTLRARQCQGSGISTRRAAMKQPTGSSERIVGEWGDRLLHSFEPIHIWTLHCHTVVRTGQWENIKGSLRQWVPVCHNECEVTMESTQCLELWVQPCQIKP